MTGIVSINLASQLYLRKFCYIEMQVMLWQKFKIVFLHVMKENQVTFYKRSYIPIGSQISKRKSSNAFDLANSFSKRTTFISKLLVQNI